LEHLLISVYFHHLYFKPWNVQVRYLAWMLGLGLALWLVPMPFKDGGWSPLLFNLGPNLNVLFLAFALPTLALLMLLSRSQSLALLSCLPLAAGAGAGLYWTVDWGQEVLALAGNLPGVLTLLGIIFLPFFSLIVYISLADAPLSSGQPATGLKRWLDDTRARKAFRALAQKRGWKLEEGSGWLGPRLEAEMGSVPVAVQKLCLLDPDVPVRQLRLEATLALPEALGDFLIFRTKEGGALRMGRELTKASWRKRFSELAGLEAETDAGDLHLCSGGGESKKVLAAGVALHREALQKLLRPESDALAYQGGTLFLFAPTGWYFDGITPASLEQRMGDLQDLALRLSRA
jgi:hypothetical protein